MNMPNGMKTKTITFNVNGMTLKNGFL